MSPLVRPVQSGSGMTTRSTVSMVSVVAARGDAEDDGVGARLPGESQMKASAATRERSGADDGGGAGSTGLVLRDTYTLGALIGQGGMGEVYEAKHVRLLGRVAIKVLRTSLLANQDA